MLKLLLLLLLSCSAFAQIEAPFAVVDYNQNPSDIEWRHIVTEHFDLIFPEEVEQDAQRVAHLLEKAYPYVTRSMEELPPRISLILQNQSVISNGFVTLAPRRSEWYLSPATDPVLTNTEWLKTLSVHEFRHVVQFQKGKHGFNKFLNIIMGEAGQALGLALTMPPWFFEGDAVGTETALTKGGRGRLPLFERDLRTLLLSGQKWDYDKAHLGSYDDYVPNHYVYGYFYTSWLRNNYGDLFLSKLANQSAETSWNPLSFYNTVDKMTHEKFEDFYWDVMKDLIKEWKLKADALTPTPYEVKNLGKRFGWTNYHYPQATPDGKVVALKNGLSFYDRFVLLDGKKEKTLFYPGPLATEFPFKLRGGKLVYLELDVDPRWGYRNFNKLKVYDLNEDKITVSKRHTKFRMAVPNHAGKKILAVEWDENQGQSIVVLNHKGKELQRVPYPKNEVITSIDWLSDSEVVFVQKDYNDMKSMVQFNLGSAEKTYLIDKAVNNIGNIAVEEGHILFESPESGIDNIWLYAKDGTRQITSALFGSYAPTIHQGKLIYNDYTAKGMNVVEKTLRMDEEQKSQDSFYPVYEKFAMNENAQGLASELLQNEEFKSSTYSEPKHALNLHSWLLLAPPLGADITVIGYSQDVLNKFFLSAGGIYNLNEKSVTGFVTSSWSQHYTVFDVRAAYGGRRQDVTVSGEEIEDKWEEGTADVGISVPWKYIQGRFTHNFSVRGFAKIIKVMNKISNDMTEVNDGALYSPGAQLNYSVVSRMARRDLNPEWGFTLFGHMEDGRDITGVDQKGSIRSVDTRFYLPGFWHHHSFFHQVAYERQKDNFYQYASYVMYPRGTRSVFLQEFTKYSGNYMMPLFYPDWHWSRYWNLKRINLNLFYDDLSGRYLTNHYRAASTGWETIFEMNFLRLAYPVSVGLRGSYVLEGREKSNNYELFLATVLGTF